MSRQQIYVEAIIQRSSFNIVHLTSMIKVDVFIEPDRPFDQAKAQRVQRGQISTQDPRPFPLTSPEDIVIQKLEWYMLGGGVSERQWTDVHCRRPDSSPTNVPMAYPRASVRSSGVQRSSSIIQ